MKPFDRVLAVSQLFILLLWEVLGVVAFGWDVGDALTAAAVWFMGLWTFNVLVASAVRTYYKLLEPTLEINNIHVTPDFTSEDIGG